MGLVGVLDQQVPLALQVGACLDIADLRYAVDVGIGLDILNGVFDPIWLFIDGGPIDNRPIDETGAVVPDTLQGDIGQVGARIIDPALLAGVVSQRLEPIEEEAQQEGGYDQEDEVLGIFDGQNYVFLNEQPRVARVALRGLAGSLDE